MSVSLSAERDRIQRQVEELEQMLSSTQQTELQLLSSETDDGSDVEDSEDEGRQSAAGLLAQRDKIQRDIQNLEDVLGPQSPTCISDEDNSSSSSEESELGLSSSPESCLQMNLVYQQVVQETLDQLETLLTNNHRQQKELLSQLSGPIKESPREQPAPSSCQQPISMYLGRFLKPYFKDKLTGLGPPANQETKEKASRMTGCLDDKKLKLKRWESWQKTLLIHSVARDTLRKLTQPKLSKVDYLSQKLSSAAETDRQTLRQQMDSLEREIDLLREKKEEELIGDRYDEHDWQKISNVDFEGTRGAEDIRCFWQNFLHPSINKTPWSKEEVQQLKEVSRRHGERHWEDIAKELGTGRTAFLCLQTFQRFASGSLKRSSWTPDEDSLLRELVDKLRIGNFIPYTQMSYFMEGRDPAQLIYRWNQVLDPSLKKGMWTKEEDELLLKAVARCGEKNWWKIRLEVPGRTDSGCRDRYYDCLKAGTKKGAFDQQERELLRQLVEKHGVGRWAKIAAEIPHRQDAQCLREWKKLSRTAAPPAQKGKQKKERKKKRSTRRIRKRLKTLKEEEEEEEEESSEDDDMVVEYMDSDEEEKKKRKNKKTTKEVVKVEKVVEEEEEYTFLPMQEWVPVEKKQSPFTFLRFRPVELPPPGVAQNPMRSTVVGQFGRSVIIGPNPRELTWEERHSSCAMMMLSPDQLRAHLHRQANIFRKKSFRPHGKIRTDSQNPLGHVTDRGLYYELQSAVTPWIGNLLIAPKSSPMTADTLRERGEKTCLHSTPFFLLLLQTMNVDAVGCKEMIEQRRNKAVVLAPRRNPRPTHANTVAAMLQRKQAMKEMQEFNLQHKHILKQLLVLQQQEQHQQQLKLQQQPAPPQTVAPSHSSPGFLLQMPPNMHPRMSPMTFPRAVFIPGAPSSHLMPPSSLKTPPPAPHRPPPVGLPAHTAPPRLNVPPVSEVPKPLNSTSPSPVSLWHRAQPLTPNSIVALAPVSVGSTPPAQHTAPSTSGSSSKSPPSPSPSSSTTPRGSRVRGLQDQEAGGSRHSGVDLGGAGNAVGGACAGVSLLKYGRNRKPSQKAKALQEAAEIKAEEAKKKAASSPRKKAQIQTVVPAPSQTADAAPPQTVVPAPPQTVVPAPPQTVAPAPLQSVAPAPLQAVAPAPPQSVVPAPPQQISTVPIQLVPQTPPPSLTRPPAAPQSPPGVVSCSLTTVTPSPAAPPLRLSIPPATPAPSDRCVSSIQNLGLAPPPSKPTNQQTASSSSSLPAPSPSDHNYTFLNLHSSMKLTPESAPKKPPKALPRRRKRGRVEEQLSLTSSQEDSGVNGTGADVSQDGKRVRTPSQKAKALQEAKAEAKKKKSRTSSSSPCKKRSRRSKEEVVGQNQSGLQLLPGQSMWVMTPGGLVQLAAPTTGQQLVAVAPPRNVSNCQKATPPRRRIAGHLRSIAPQPTVAVPVSLPVLNLSLPVPTLPTCKPLPPAFLLQPVSNPDSSPMTSCLPQPPPKLFLPYKGTVRADPTAPPPLRREALQFDPSLMFLESPKAVRDWLSGCGGVVIPGAGVSLPYLPPFVSNLRTLSALLRAKDALTTSALQLLSQGSAPRHSPPKPRPDGTQTTTPRPDCSTQTTTPRPDCSTQTTTPRPDYSTQTTTPRPDCSTQTTTPRTGRTSQTTSSPPLDLPDSTSDLRSTQDTQAPSVSSDLLQEEEAELVAVTRQLVVERFSDNPAYQLLKARFLSCFTVPALLATLQPVREKTIAHPANEEEEEEEEEEVINLNTSKDRAQQRRAERSLLLCDEAGAPANHFSGIITSTPEPDRTSLDQTVPVQ